MPLDELEGHVGGAAINAMLDTYYEYNTNNPTGRVNFLRAFATATSPGMPARRCCSRRNPTS